ncbi:MAG: prepilin-type N-terminal cleavage/methylation domain-containing protein [Patescibacteria group bacterium]|nr:prepilin-type N-terminal cleavage/methylation domain-containing protein [Patescibacteria group bacterium]
MKIVNKIKNNIFGFSLIELLVSVSIIVIITSISVASFTSWKKDENLRQSALVLMSNMQKIQNMSLTGQMYNGSIPIAYGAYFNDTNPSSYTLFADMNGDYIYDDDGTEKIEDFDLLGDVCISNLIPVASNKLTIIFKLPKAEIYINQDTLDNVAEIDVIHNITSNFKTIKIKRITGQIDME